jgi:hypothetical protein
MLNKSISTRHFFQSWYIFRTKSLKDRFVRFVLTRVEREITEAKKIQNAFSELLIRESMMLGNVR